MCIYRYKHTYLCIQTYAYIKTRTHVYTHTYTDTSKCFVGMWDIHIYICWCICMLVRYRQLSLYWIQKYCCIRLLFSLIYLLVRELNCIIGYPSNDSTLLYYWCLFHGWKLNFRPIWRFLHTIRKRKNCMCLWRIELGITLFDPRTLPPLVHKVWGSVRARAHSYVCVCVL